MSVAKNRLQKIEADFRNLHFKVVPILDFKGEEKFDLIVTQFFLDCFEGDELKDVIAKIGSLLKAGGKWSVADFRLPGSGLPRLRARMVLRLAYAFFRLAVKLPARRLIDPAPIFAANRLRLLRRKEFDSGLLYAEVWEKRD